MQYFSVNGVECTIVPLPTEEANKSIDLVFEIARELETFKLNRYLFFFTFHCTAQLHKF